MRRTEEAGASVFSSVRDECADQCPQTALPTGTDLHPASVGTTLLTALMSSKSNPVQVQPCFPSPGNSSEHTVTLPAQGFSVLSGNPVFGKGCTG